MVFVVVGLGALVLFMAHKTKPVGAAAPDTVQSPGPNENIPSLGATDKFSPALTGGSALIARDNRLRQRIDYKNARNKTGALSTVVADPQSGSEYGIMGGLTNSNSMLGFKREDPPNLTTQQAVYQPRPPSMVQRFKF